MQINLTDNELAIFKKIAAAAKKQGTEAYAIGGFVRDKIIGRPTKDIDIVCAGDGIALAEETAKQFSPRPQVTVFKTFGTAQIKIYLKQNENEEKAYIGETNRAPSPPGRGRGVRVTLSQRLT